MKSLYDVIREQSGFWEIFVIVKMNCYGIFRDSFSICRHCTEIFDEISEEKIMSGQYKIMYSSMDQFYDQTNGTHGRMGQSVRTVG